MSALALIFVVCAAMLHACWNYLLKTCGGGIGLVTLASGISTILLTLPAMYIFCYTDYTLKWSHVGMILGSAIIHSFYSEMLDRMYRAGGDLSVVYPLARATGPLLTIIVACTFFAERMSAIAAGGALLIGISALLLTGDPRKLRDPAAKKSIKFALITGALIACYTVWDKQAVALFLIAPIVFDWGANLMRVCILLPYAAKRDPGGMKLAWKNQRRAVLGVAIMGPLGYILVLYAMKMAPISYVAPARELSILFAALLGTTLLGEKDRKRRLFAACGMVVGFTGLAAG
jgi:uncharacterized membrane protein